jgi:hypothetical protein
LCRAYPGALPPPSTLSPSPMGGWRHAAAAVEAAGSRKGNKVKGWVCAGSLGCGRTTFGGHQDCFHCGLCWDFTKRVDKAPGKPQVSAATKGKGSGQGKGKGPAHHTAGKWAVYPHTFRPRPGTATAGKGPGPGISGPSHFRVDDMAIDELEPPQDEETPKQAIKRARDALKREQHTLSFLEAAYPEGGSTCDAAKAAVEASKHCLEGLLEEGRTGESEEDQLESKKKWRTQLLATREKIQAGLTHELDMLAQHQAKADKAQANLDDQNVKLEQAEQDIKALQRALGAQVLFIPKPTAVVPQCTPEQWAAFLQHQRQLAENTAASEQAEICREYNKLQLEQAEKERQVAHIEATKRLAAARKVAEDAGTALTLATQQQTAEPNIFTEALEESSKANAVLKEREEQAAALAKGNYKVARAAAAPY